MTPLPSLEDYLSIADRLPPAPRILPRLLSILNDPASDVGQITELISFDPGLTAGVLRASNSAFFALPEPARDVGEAVQLLGVDFIYQLAAGACGAAAFQARRNGAPPNLWPHAATAALAAQLLAKDLGLDAGLLFTAALLHNIGQPVLAEHWKERYWQLVEQTRGAPAQLPVLEERTFALNHAELGGRLLAQWKFPPGISASVWHHHAPVAGMPFEKETACLTLADAVAEAITQRPGRAELFQLTPGQEQALAILKLALDDLESYLARTQENFEFVNALCRL